MNRQFQVFMICMGCPRAWQVPSTRKPNLSSGWKEKRREMRWNTAGSSESVAKKITSSVAEGEDSENLSVRPNVADQWKSEILSCKLEFQARFFAMYFKQEIVFWRLFWLHCQAFAMYEYISWLHSFSDTLSKHIEKCLFACVCECLDTYWISPVF